MLCAMLSLTFTACKTPKLEAGGAYAQSVTNTVGTNLVITATSDLTLYSADAAFELAYKTLDAVFLIERNNRQYLWNLSPNIKHTMDSIRVTAQQVVNEYADARTAYLAHPTPLGLTGVQAVLAKIQQLLFVANAAIGNGTVTGTNAPAISTH